MSNLPRVEVTNHTLPRPSVTTNTTRTASRCPSPAATTTQTHRFQFQGRTTYWNPSVAPFPHGQAGRDRAMASSVESRPDGELLAAKHGLYNVLLDGDIVDGGTVYSYTGFVLATFTSNSQ